MAFLLNPKLPSPYLILKVVNSEIDHGLMEPEKYSVHWKPNYNLERTLLYSDNNKRLTGALP